MHVLVTKQVEFVSVYRVVLELDSQNINHEYQLAVGMEWVVASLIFAQVVDSNLYCVVVVEELLEERVEGYLLQLLRQRLFRENTILARLTLTRYLDWLIVRLFHMVHGSRCFWALIHSF